MAADNPIHPIYRICFNYVEPLLAFGGVVQVLLNPEAYLSIALPNQRYVPATTPLFTDIAGGWLIVVFHDLVTLRVFNRNVQVWSFILGANLISDVAFSYGTYQDLGAARFFGPALWTRGDWLTMVTTVIPLAFKVTFLLGLGVQKGGQKVIKKT